MSPSEEFSPLSLLKPEWGWKTHLAVSVGTVTLLPVPTGEARMIITIDGTAASGKTSAAEKLAAALGFHLLKTGAMYRAAGLVMRDAGIDVSEYHHDTSAVAAAVAGMTFDMPVGGQVILNGEDFT